MSYNEKKQKKGIYLLSIVAALCVFMFSTMTLQATDLDDETQNAGDMTVQGTVSEKAPGQPTYVVRIPSMVDFGKITIPQEEIDSFKDLSFDITLIESTNIPTGSGICVLVSDSASELGAGAPRPNTLFRMKKDTQNLDYSVCLVDGEGNITNDLFVQGSWYENGFLYGVFNSTAEPGSILPGTLRLNEKQLYGKTSADVAGKYTGTLHFYTTVKSIQDVSK